MALRPAEVVLCLHEKPHMQVLVRRVPTQPMRRGHMARREFEYTRHGTVTILVSLNVYDGSMWGCCLEANDHEHFLWALRQLTRGYPRARRLHLIMDNGASHIAQETRTYVATHPRLRVFYTPPHASWLNQAELLLCAFADKYLDRFDPHSRQHFMDHLNASWPEYNQRFARPFDCSWTCRDLYGWVRKKETLSLYKNLRYSPLVGSDALGPQSLGQARVGLAVLDGMGAVRALPSRTNLAAKEVDVVGKTAVPVRTWLAT